MTGNEETTPVDVVGSFVIALGISLRALATSTTEISRVEPTAPLTADTESGRTREGVLLGVGAFKLHGFGCRVELESGEVVDFDWDEHGRASFDVRRVRGYARSIGLASGEEELRVALLALRDAGFLVEHRPGWFHIA